MKYKIRCESGEAVTEAMDEIFKDECQHKLEKYAFPEDATCRILVKGKNRKEKNKKVELTLQTNSGVLHAEAVNSDAYVALRQALDKAITQLERVKTKYETKHKKATNLGKTFAEMETAEETDGPIVTRKQLMLSPISEEEALVQMELSGHSFFIYLNSETGNVDVLYKKTGVDALGCIEAIPVK